MRSRLLALAIGAVLTCVAVEANATIFCELKSTNDGFVALRAGPAPTARLIGRMKAGDHLQVMSEEKGSWTRASWWKKSAYPNGVLVGRDKPHGTGWMNAKLITPDSCG